MTGRAAQEEQLDFFNKVPGKAKQRKKPLYIFSCEFATGTETIVAKIAAYTKKQAKKLMTITASEFLGLPKGCELSPIRNDAVIIDTGKNYPDIKKPTVIKIHRLSDIPLS
ncbi:MAG: hypothetical protein WC565_02475 [Parcubacteria group bacterium]